MIKGSRESRSAAGGHPRRGVRRVIERCLEKDVRKRFRDIGDVRNELDEIQSDPRGAGFRPRRSPAGSPRRRFRGSPLPSLVTADVVGAAVWMLKPRARGGPVTVARFIYTLPENQTFRNAGRPVVALSPDGRHFVYNATGGLFLRPMDGLNARLIAGTEES